MKKHFFLLAFLLPLSFIACNKEEEKEKDERNNIIGNYTGVRKSKSWSGDTSTGWIYYTFDIELELIKRGMKDTIELLQSPQTSGNGLIFLFKKGAFKSTLQMHVPYLKVKDDSLYFNYQPGLEESSRYEYFAKKVK